MIDPRAPLSDDELGELLRRSAQDEAPPAAVRARAVAIDSVPARVARQATKLLRRIVAVALPGEGGPTTPFAPALGVRGAAGGQWLYRADECEIDLRVAPRGHERWSVAGQLFGDLDATRVVLDGPGGARSAEIGPTREFSFTDLPAGRYSLAVQAGEVEVVVPQVEVG